MQTIRTTIGQKKLIGQGCFVARDAITQGRGFETE